MNDTLPILYSFRRCPFAIRARLAIAAAGVQVELREVVLRDKPPTMLEASAKGTVPVLVLDDGEVIDESLDVMKWALKQSDPDNWLDPEEGDLTEMEVLIAEFDGPFKHHLDRFKYATRYKDIDPLLHREAAGSILMRLETRLYDWGNLFGSRPSYADAAVFPLIRQFWNAAGDYTAAGHFDLLGEWLDRWQNYIPWPQTPYFQRCMKKYPQWHAGEAGQAFPD